MRVEADCIPCYLKQGISTLRIAGMNDKEISSTINSVLGIINQLSLEETPCYNSTVVLRKIYDIIGIIDPYKEAKIKWNDYALNQYKDFSRLVEKSDDRLHKAFKVAVAGNIIDMGITPDFDVDLAMNEITDKEFDHDDYNDLKPMLKNAKTVMILGDNSGEIVFDMVLVEEFKRLGLNVVYSVKGGPILNDSTMEDAVQVGLTSICEVVDTGNDLLGVVFEKSSQAFIEAFKRADIIISKGQANFESLEGSKRAGDKTFFVLRAKCPLVAKCLGVEFGDIVLKRNRS
ncbi:MAG TPA: ARMT1-like domain-containing protein [Pseudobacteroides sp.]|uniref:damage-control phosphatase ARMT1 family protein n=1 Tax=Pseudobacteroides sp. TaxID=1968840 RepID=UPI002F931678